eukprot:TRINITY_DN88_c0_g1_i1.p1 TRINITY_DN88_c0_g1~~TRINITY_DN88_c0_g1_i1.p1  ORF type:complete len:1755 (-),score=211.95 TRINITY_DN88_c0_g1_i1:16687-21951(-)
MAKFKDQDSELTAFEKFEQELKSIIFGVLFVMLKDDEDSLITQVFLTVADGLQNLTLVFSDSINYPWRNEAFMEYLVFCLQLLQIAYWCMMLTWLSYLVIYYFFIMIICLVILDIIYIGYSFSVKRFTVMWPLYILRSTCSLFVTVLFMPLIDLFTSMVQCDYIEGKWVHYAFSDVVCWQGMHILHGTVALIVTGIFVVICCIVGLTFFESKNEPTDPSARVNARAEAWQNVYKIVCILLTTFFIQDEYRWMLTVVITAGAYMIFRKSFDEQPFYNETMNHVVDVVNGIFLWSCVVLCLVMLLEDTEFSGGVQLFFLGSPVVGFIIYSGTDRRKKLLMNPIEQFDSGDEWYQKVRHYMSLIYHKDTSRAAAIELKGFIYDHEETCDKRDCPLKLYKQNISGMIKDKKRKMGRNLGAENNNLLWGYANKLFQTGLSKFPNATMMRISYAIFLKEKLGNKNMAVSELFHAEKNGPPFDEQFVIYRYRKLMEEETTEVQGEGNPGSGAQSANLDVVSIIAYDNHMRQCKEQIERAAYFHMEFWTELQQRRPDLAKLSKTGSKINTTIAEVEDHWTKLQKINPNNPKALRMYGDFLIEILNDREAGQELISRAKDNVASRTAIVPDFYGGANSGSNTADLWMTTAGSDGSPCVLASGEQNKLGEIIQVNMGMCRAFGYTKNEMLGKKVDVLMPQLYSKHHDPILKASLLNAEEGAQNDEKQGDKNIGGRFILGRHKSGYLTPLWLETRIFFLVSQGSLLGATFKPEKKNHSVCYLLLDANQEIVGVSSLCVTVLRISNSVIRNFKLPVSVLAPELLEPAQNAQYRSKEGGILDFYIPDTERREDRKTDSASRIPKEEKSSGTLPVRLTEEKAKEEEDKDEAEPEEMIKPKIKASKHVVKMNCHLTDIVFGNETKQAGYILRLESVDERKIELEGFKVPEYPKFPEFQIVFDPVKYRFLCAWSKEDAQKEKELLLLRYKSLTALWKQSSAIKAPGDVGGDAGDGDITTQEEEEALRLRNRQTTIDFTMKERRNYGEGIKTKRLQNGVFVEVNEINKMAERELEEQMRLEEEKRRGSEKDLMSADAVRESLKSRKGLIAVIKDRSDPPSILKLKITGYIIGLVFLAIAAIEFGITTTSFQELNESISLVRSSYRRITLFMKISYSLTKAVLANPKTSRQMLFPGNYPAFINDCKYSIEQSLSELYLAQNNITLAKIPVSDNQRRLLDEKVVALEFKDTSTPNGKKASYYTLTEAVLQMTSSIFTVLNLQDSSYLFSNDDVDFILYNVFKDVYYKVMESSNYYVLDLQDRARYKHVVVLVLFIVAVSLVSISVFVLFPLVSNVGKIRAQVLSLFLDIPLSDVRGLAKRCERFLASNNEERNADMLDSSESQGKDGGLLDDEEIEGGTNGGAQVQEARPERGSRRRRFINDKSSNKSFFFRYVAAMLIICGFYITNYVLTRVYLEKIEDCSAELNATIVAQPLDATVLSTIQSLIGIGHILPLTESATFQRLVRSDIDRMQKVNHDVQYLHLKNKDSYPDTYVNAYQDIMINNLCKLSSTLGFTFDCEEYIAGISREGLQTIMVQYVEVIREMLRLYQEIKSNSEMTEDQKTKAYQSLLRNNDSAYIEEADTIVHGIMERSFQYLSDKLIRAYDELLEYEITRRVIMFIVLLLLIILGFIVMWAPFISKLSTEIWRTKCMLTIIPKEVIALMKSVQKFLNDPNIFSAKGDTQLSTFSFILFTCLAFANALLHLINNPLQQQK